ncbi:MAG TPA: hypothetical protein VMU26_07845 [Candidatus Polarisedimenticolia bacterium]|nr:hypothetical protein [Candidatus Polarisedimenticolia bacterium]
MRHYIRTITRVENHPDFDFTEAMDGGWSWETEKQAQEYLAWTDPSGRAISRSPFNGVKSVCTDFRIERRPQGDYVISCNLNFVP